jgi:predicted ATPase
MNNNLTKYITYDCKSKKIISDVIPDVCSVIVMLNSQLVDQKSVASSITELQTRFRNNDIPFIFKNIGINETYAKTPYLKMFPVINNIDMKLFVNSTFGIRGAFSFNYKQICYIAMYTFYTIITGENFSGKTSFVDSLFYMFTKKLLKKGQSSIVNTGAGKLGATLEFTNNVEFVKNIKNSKSCTIDGKDYTASDFDAHIQKKYPYMNILHTCLKTPIGNNINKYISKVFDIQSGSEDLESNYIVTKSQYDVLSEFYNKIMENKESGDGDDSNITIEFKKYSVAVPKEAPTINNEFILTLETFVNNLIQQLDLSFYIDLKNLLVHNQFVNTSSIKNYVKLSDTSTFQHNLIVFIIRSAMLKLWAISITQNVNEKFPLFIIDENFDSLSLDSNLMLKLLERTKKWFHRVIFVTNSPAILSIIKESKIDHTCYTVVKPKLINNMENSNTGQGSYTTTEKTITDIKITNNNIDEKLKEENFTTHVLYNRILVNNFTSEFKCKKCAKVQALNRLEKHLENCT